MAWRVWRGLPGAGVAALLLAAPINGSLAQTAPSAPATTTPDWLSSAASAAKTVKVPTINVITASPAPAPPVAPVKTAAAKPNPPAKKPEPKKIVAARSRPEPNKPAVASNQHAGPPPLAPAPPKPAAPSYTVTTTNGNVTYTTTHVVAPTAPPWLLDAPLREIVNVALAPAGMVATRRVRSRESSTDLPLIASTISLLLACRRAIY